MVLVPWLAWLAGAAFSWRDEPIQGYYTDYLGWWLEFGPPALVRVLAFNALFLITSPVMRLNRRYVTEITDGLIPELQKRGLVRSEYTTTMLRDHLREF